MSDPKKYQLVERRTYLNGRLKGQYEGREVSSLSGRTDERNFGLEILKGSVYAEEIIKWQDLDESLFEKYANLNLKMPSEILLTLKGEESTPFYVKLQGVRIINLVLSKVQSEGQISYGDIHADIVAYFTHDDQVEITEVVDSDEIILEKDEKTSSKYRLTSKRYKNGKTNLDFSFNAPSAFRKLIDQIMMFLGICIMLLVLIPLILGGWQVILFFLLIIFGSSMLSWVISWITARRSWLLSILGFFLLLFLFGQTLSFIKSRVTKTDHDDGMVVEPEKNDTQTKKRQQLITGEFVSHQLNWNDYNNRGYSGNVTIKTMDWFNSKNHRNNLPYTLATVPEYDLLVSDLRFYNQPMIDSILSMYDSIQVALSPNRTEFAEIIVSSIQSIPYTLIVESECSPEVYPPGEFIHEYLKEAKPCAGGVKYGIYSQVEFIATLDGDCDTRSLLLYSILKHFRYEVVMLTSQTFKHAIIAVELSGIDGRFFKINNKRYYLWETTVPGIPPGVFPLDKSNPNLWKISLI